MASHFEPPGKFRQRGFMSEVVDTAVDESGPDTPTTYDMMSMRSVHDMVRLLSPRRHARWADRQAHWDNDMDKWHHMVCMDVHMGGIYSVHYVRSGPLGAQEFARHLAHRRDA